MELPYLSVSTVDSFATCPRRGYLRKHSESVHSPGLESSATAFGSLVHEILEHYQAQDEVMAKYLSLVEFYDELCKERDVYDFQRYKDLREAVEIYEQSNPPLDNIVSVELPFEVTLGDFVVRGIIDRVDYLGSGVYRITDYKTSFMQKKKWELDNDLQLTIYDVALREIQSELTLDGLPLPEIKEVICCIHYIRTNTVVEADPYSEAQRKSAVNFMFYMGHKIDTMTEEPPPQANPFCFYCDWKESCALYKSDFAELQRIPEGADTEELVEAFVKLQYAKKTVENKHKEIQGILMTRMDAEGSNKLVAGRYSVFPYSTKRTYYDVDGLREALSNWERFAAIDPKAVEKNGTKADQKVLAKYRRTKKTAPYLKTFEER